MTITLCTILLRWYYKLLCCYMPRVNASQEEQNNLIIKYGMTS